MEIFVYKPSTSERYSAEFSREVADSRGEVVQIITAVSIPKIEAVINNPPLAKKYNSAMLRVKALAEREYKRLTEQLGETHKATPDELYAAELRKMNFFKRLRLAGRLVFRKRR